jgi:Pro-kumamolisin, activation domain
MPEEMMDRKFAVGLLGITSMVVLALLGIRTTAGTRSPQWQSRSLVTERIDDSRRITLRGNTRPEAIARNDRGPVWPGFRLEHMLLQLKRPAEAEQSLDEYIEGLTDKTSPDYHKWLSAVQLGNQYGVSDKDIDFITGWLESRGIAVNYVYPNHMVMDISGTAWQLREALHVEIHFLEVDGEMHYANVNDPQIPAALAPAITGIVSMHDFKPHTMLKQRTQYTFASSNCGTCFAVTPGDLATIYNLNPLFSQGLSGQGQTIVVIEDTNVFSTADWTTFRTTFGLSGYSSGSFTQVHPNFANNCTNPGVNADDGEAILDAEYASATAPNAAIELASCANTTTFGGLIALQNLLNAGNPPSIVSISYGECEAVNGAAANSAFNSAYQQAATAGVSIFVSSGDESAASCDANAATATHGIGVSGFSSTAFNVSVGGTDFIDTANGQNTTYWSSTNSSTFESALGYIPEIPWNDSCASAIIATFVTGSGTTTGTTGFCNNAGAGGTGLRTTASGSGGPSGCATGTATTTGVVGGSCAGYAKPSWQSGLFGNPNDGVRDLPDVSLFSANGIWGHFFVFCYSDTGTGRGGLGCTGAPSAWNAAGGTSFASPIMAAIQSLVNQRTGSTEGNPNPTYYAIAKTEYGGGGSAQCNSSAQQLSRRGVASTCIFYDVTQGDIDVNCTGAHNCFRPSGTDGALSTGAITGLTFTGGSGYTSAPTCTISAPANTTTAYNGGTAASQATCTATISGAHAVNGVTLNTAGNGYVSNAVCTLSGGGGTGATCTASGAGTATYQAAFPATAGWDFATGIGTVNAYNLVFASNW